MSRSYSAFSLAARRVLLAVACAVATIGGAATAQPAAEPLAVVAADGTASVNAGLSPGDRVFGAVVPDSQGEVALGSPLALDLLAAECAPRGGVVLVGESEGRTRRFTLPAAPWGPRTGAQTRGGTTKLGASAVSPEWARSGATRSTGRDSSSTATPGSDRAYS